MLLYEWTLAFLAQQAREVCRNYQNEWMNEWIKWVWKLRGSLKPRNQVNIDHQSNEDETSV